MYSFVLCCIHTFAIGHCFSTIFESCSELCTAGNCLGFTGCDSFDAGIRLQTGSNFVLITFVFKHEFGRIETIWKSKFQGIKRNIFPIMIFIRELSEVLSQKEPEPATIQINYGEIYIIRLGNGLKLLIIEIPFKQLLIIIESTL